MAQPDTCAICGKSPCPRCGLFSCNFTAARHARDHRLVTRNGWADDKMLAKLRLELKMRPCQPTESD